MVSQVRLNIDNTPFFLNGQVYTAANAAVLQIGARSGDIEQYTVMAKYTAGANVGKWAPYDDVTDTDGRACPAGILLTAITEAAIQAADVNAPIAVGGDAVAFDTNKLVIENSYTLATEIATGTIAATTIRRKLRELGLFDEDTIDVQGYENA